MFRSLPIAGLVLLVWTGAAWAQDTPPVPWEITGTSTVHVGQQTTATHRVEHRIFQKNRSFILRAGFSYLSRGDFYTNPGIGADLSWYPTESVGIDLISATFFISDLNTTAAALRESTGLLPDSQKPVVRIMTGVRHAFAYGKAVIEALDIVVHLDASLVAHLGILVTDEAVNPGGDLGLGFQAVAYRRFLVWLEGGWFMSYENRTATKFASGPMATVGVGLHL